MTEEDTLLQTRKAQIRATAGGKRDTSNDFVPGRDPNIVLRWVDRLTTALMVYFLFGGWLMFVPSAVWIIALRFVDGKPGPADFGLFTGAFHLVVGFAIRKFAVLPLHVRLACADGVQSRPYRAVDPAPHPAPTARPAEPPMGPKNSPLPPRTMYK